MSISTLSASLSYLTHLFDLTKVSAKGIKEKVAVKINSEEFLREKTSTHWLT
jgi:hypothetical protein